MTGFVLILSAGILMVATTLFVARFVPRLAVPAAILALGAGAVGFVLFCIAQPDPFNLALGALFVVVAAHRVVKLRRRAAQRRQAAGSTDDAAAQ